METKLIILKIEFSRKKLSEKGPSDGQSWET